MQGINLPLRKLIMPSINILQFYIIQALKSHLSTS